MDWIEAARAGQTTRLRDLMAAGIDVNSVSPGGGTALAVAIDAGQAGAVQVLLEAGADVNARSAAGVTALQTAAGAGDPAIVALVLAARPDLEASCDQGPIQGTALTWAACQGHTEAVQLLLAAGANPDAVDSSGTTALMKAAWWGHAESVRALLAGGAAINAANQLGQTALIAAASRGHNDIVRDLLGAGADPRARTVDGTSALLLAVKGPHVQTVRLLLQANADVNAARHDGQTPLYAAVVVDHRQLVPLLLAAGADPNVALRQNDSLDGEQVVGTTPLMLATVKRRPRSFRALLAAGADVNVRNFRGDTALTLAAGKGLLRQVDRLRAAGATGTFDEREFFSRSLLQAAARGSSSRVRVLLRGGADVHVRDERPNHHGKTPLHHAAEHGHLEAVQALLEGGADVHATETSSHFVGNGWTPLLYAARSGHAEVLRVLLRAGADPNARERYRSAGLILAAGAGHPDAVRVLLEGGADPNVQERKDGRSALIAAASAGHEGVVRVLLAAGARDGGSALVAATQTGHIDTVRSLLQAGIPADAREESSPGRTALIAAAELDMTLTVQATDAPIDEEDRGPWEAIQDDRATALLRLLLQAGADVNGRDGEGRTALLTAAARRNMLHVHTQPERGRILHWQREKIALPVVRLLLEAGADVNAQDNAGDTALMKLADIDRRWCPSPVEAVRVLLAAGARLDLRDRTGATVLVRDARQGKKEILCLLLAAGADVEARTADGSTALIVAAAAQPPAALLPLLRAGAAVNAANNRGRTALLELLHNYDTNTEKYLRALLQAGADVNARDEDGSTALDVAVERDWEEAIALLRTAGAVETGARERELREAASAGDRARVQQLLAEGADCHRRFNGSDALQLAVRAGHADIVADLLTAGADANRVPDQREPHLHTAICNHNRDLVEILLAGGAAADALNDEGEPALRLAIRTGQEEVVAALRAAGATVDPMTALFLERSRFPEAAQRPEFQAMRQELTELSGVPGQALDWLPGVFAFALPPGPEAEEQLRSNPGQSSWMADYLALQQKARMIVADVQPQCRARGCFVWDLGSGRGCGPASRFVGLAPTADKYAVLAAIGVVADHEDATVPTIQFLRGLEAEYPFELVGCSGKATDVVFARPLRDPLDLARRLYGFCREMVEIGTGNLEALAERLAATGEAQFWWD
jgi:ankyrin repeat protein